MAQVQQMAPAVGADISHVTPPTTSLPPSVDLKDDVEASVVEHEDAGSTFEVLGLMRTTSRQDTSLRRGRSGVDQHVSSIPEKDREEEHRREVGESTPPKRSSITGLGLRQKLKDKIPGVRPGSASKQEKDHPKHDSMSPDPDFEVLGLMKTNTGTSEDNKPPVDNKINKTKPSLERHISSIPQDDDDDDDAAQQESLISPKLKRHISSIPSHDYDSEDEAVLDDTNEPLTPSPTQNPHVVAASSDFEVHGLMRMTTNDGTFPQSPSLLKKPGLERHISRIPQHDDDDEEEEKGRQGGSSVLKSPSLVRTISSIPGHDYDSEGEGYFA